MPEGWPYCDVTPDVIRDPLRRAEKLLNDRGEVIERGNDLQIMVPDDIAAGLDELNRDALLSFAESP